MENWMDLAMVIMVVGGAYLGWRLGVLRSLAMVVGAVAGSYMAEQHYEEVATRLSEFISSEEIRQVISFSGIALAVFVATIVVASTVRRLLRLMFLGWLDGAAGAVVGVMLAMAIAALAVGVLEPLMGEGFRETVSQSDVTQFIASQVSRAVNLLPEAVQEYVDGTPLSQGLAIMGHLAE